MTAVGTGAIKGCRAASGDNDGVSVRYRRGEPSKDSLGSDKSGERLQSFRMMKVADLNRDGGGDLILQTVTLKNLQSTVEAPLKILIATKSGLLGGRAGSGQYRS